MDCLVDNKMNSNLPSCPNCGLNTAAACNLSMTPFVLCERCKSAISFAVANNPMPQTHRDFVPYPSQTRPRWCTCQEGTSMTTISTELLPMTHLDPPGKRPRSSSSPISIDASLFPPASQPSLVSQQPNLKPCSELQGTPTTDSSTSSHRQGDSQVEHSNASSSGQCYPCLSPSQEPNSRTTAGNRPRLHSDSVQHIKYAFRDTTAHVCDRCGGISGTISEANLNENCRQHSASPDEASTASTPSIYATPQSQTPTTPSSVSSTFSNQNDQTSSSKQFPCSGRTEDSASNSGDVSITISEPPSNERGLNFPVPTNDKSWDNIVFTRKSGAEPLGPYTSRTQMISHNMEHNRITTSNPRKAPGSTRTSPKGRTNKHFLDATGRPSRHTYHAGRGTLYRAHPDNPLSLLPHGLLSELHNVSHENEDLSADVVYSLHFRNYEIKEILGKGISSTVRRVTEKTTGIEYAVKIIDISGEKGETGQVEQTKKDTVREIRILRMCGGHPNIIELHDVFETPTFIFLVFEICKKGELFDYLTSVVSLSEKRTRIFMRQLIEAVEFIHDQNIVHRDLKPENILLDDNLNIKVSDFGFATTVEKSEELSELCGTPGYLAPEVLAHSMYENVSGYGKEVDMWACGVIMYTLLCGAPPFWNRRQMMMLRSIMSADYTFNTPEWDDITDAPKNLIKKLLLVNPKERLTAKQALAHPFFHSQDATEYKKYQKIRRATLALFGAPNLQVLRSSLVKEEKTFEGRRKFRVGAFCIIFYTRLNYFYKHPPPISVDIVRNNPYCVKIMRKVIDTCAFGMYKHWVKRVDNQNRAALFEHTLRDDWKHSLLTVHGTK